MKHKITKEENTECLNVKACYTTQRFALKRPQSTFAMGWETKFHIYIR
jgi:hypothetical protein